MLTAAPWVSSPLSQGAFHRFTSIAVKLTISLEILSLPVRFTKPEGISWVVWKVPEKFVSIGRIMMCQPGNASYRIAADAFDTKNVRFHYAVSDASGNWKVVEDTQKNENIGECIVLVNDMNAADREAAWTGGLWVAVEWKTEGIFDFDYLIAM